ncbi:uncharacterized protein LY79DRAFT_395364 [Colletotrichum navitas]|uniref:Uncharacterized protein n=1 Tax=Colletotrichum navitas TaxID=681940 RepID=A0AAD8V040_9PEZI|nr:uncharacterized protein LY79DRAFT_395364 [Colletotrichum navitas]KAK1573928.1 hypothetical protein LY79DRAFT_395364 [Colletotrichum navitas]
MSPTSVLATLRANIMICADGLVVKFSVAIKQRRGAGGSIPPRRTLYPSLLLLFPSFSYLHRSGFSSHASIYIPTPVCRRPSFHTLRTSRISILLTQSQTSPSAQGSRGRTSRRLPEAWNVLKAKWLFLRWGGWPGVRRVRGDGSELTLDLGAADDPGDTQDGMWCR